MTAAAFAFYVFAVSTVTGGLMTVLSRNPVHSVLWLILAFLSSAGLFVLLGAEFVAMLMIIVYVGAVAVLFLFVVMMLDIDFAALKAEMARYMPLALLIGVVILMQLAVAFGNWGFDAGSQGRIAAPAGDMENTRALGMLLYDRYFLLFQLAGLVLLVAMIGAIVLTLRHKPGVRRQVIMDQVLRTRASGMRMSDPKTGEGIGE
jgi:NADH-quinone oxidoreductase subunit J